MVTVMLLRMVLYAPILAIGGVVMVMVTNPQLGWIVVLAVAVVFTVIAVLFRFTLPRFKIMQTLIDRVNLVAREMLNGLSVVRAFNREGFEENRFDAASRKLRDTQLFTNRAMAFMMPTMMLVMNLTSVAIVWFGAQGVAAGTMQTGDLIAFITYAMVIIMGCLIMGMVSIMLPRADVAAQRLSEVLATEPTVRDPEAPIHVRSDAASGARIAFDDVSFRYTDDGDPALSHVSFVAEPGTTLAIVGPTGSGKSTIVKLIERFYDPTAGSVTLDGVDLRELSQADLRANLGYVPQKAFLFEGTVESNIAYGDEGADEVAKAITSLSTYFRIFLSNGQEKITLAQEFKHTEAYLTMQKIRYGQKLNSTLELAEDARDLPMLKILIQPLVENAINHGLKPKENGEQDRSAPA